VEQKNIRVHRPGHAAQKNPPVFENLMIQNASIYAGFLVDGSGEPFLKHIHIRVRNGFIDKVEPACGDILKKPDVWDLSGQTVLPLLTDSHVHLFMSGTTDLNARKRQTAAGFSETRRIILDNLEKHRLRGIGAVRDAGDRDGKTLRFKNSLKNPEKIPVRIHAAGAGWHGRGRYGKLIARSPFKGETLARAILDRQGDSDHVKVINSDLNSLTEFAKQTRPQFDLGEMTAAVAAARRLNLGLMAHANGKIPTKICVDAGCRSIEHGFFMGAETIRKMADKGVTWVPTAYAIKAHCLHLEKTGGNADVAQRTLDHQLNQIRLARESGVTLALGTDAGSPGADHGDAALREFETLMEGGLTLEETTRTASLNGARLIGLENEGAIAPGMRARMVAVPGDPFGLPESLERARRL
jgi:imidazolonepropionase-like amidohydrolase